MHTPLPQKRRSAFSERKKVLSLYILFFGMIFLSFVTPPQAAVLALMMCILILAGIYSIRSQVDEDTLLESHCTFLIRTFWRANLCMLYAVLLCAAYLLMFTEYGAFTPCFGFIGQHWQSMLMNWDAERYGKLLAGCGHAFYKANAIHVYIAGSLLLVPPTFYIFYRFFVGWRHAVRGVRVNP